MSKKVTLTFSDETYEAITRAAGGTPLGRFLRETVERHSLDDEGEARANRPSLEARVGRVVDAKLDAAVARLLKDQTYVELETAERVAGRALKWAKIAGFFLAVPAAIFVALFSFLGVKTYFDLRDVGTKIADAEKTIVLAKEISRQSQATSKDLIDQAARLKSGLTEAKAVVARLREVEQQIPQLIERQRDLEKKFKTIAGGRIKLGSSELDLEQPFREYVKNLDDIGFPVSGTQITVVRSNEERFAQNAYYNPSDKTVILGRAFWKSTSVALREYTHHVLLAVQSGRPLRGVYGTLETALADYFPSSFLNNPRVGEGVDLSLEGGRNFIRTLENNLSFSDLADYRGPFAMYSNASAWGGLWWDLRSALGKKQTDRLLFTVWRELPKDISDEDLKVWFPATLLEKALAEASTDGARMAVRKIWRVRGFPTASP